MKYEDLKPKTLIRYGKYLRKYKRRISLRGKAAGSWSWQFTSVQCRG